MDTGVTVTVDVGWGETVKVALPLAALYVVSPTRFALSVWLPAATLVESKLAVQFNGEIVPLHAAAVGVAPSTVKLNAPVGGAEPENVIFAVNGTAVVPETMETGVTVTRDVGWGETVKAELPLAVL